MGRSLFTWAVVKQYIIVVVRVKRFDTEKHQLFQRKEFAMLKEHIIGSNVPIIAFFGASVTAELI